MYLLWFYIPASHLEEVKTALFNKGAGTYNNYSHCSWETAGKGQFKALEGSNPYIGKSGEISKVDEFRVEMVCDDTFLHDVLKELHAVHPYEQPAFGVIKLEDIVLNL
jgi:hypothetical protein